MARTVEVEGVEFEIMSSDESKESWRTGRCTDEDCTCLDGFSLKAAADWRRS